MGKGFLQIRCFLGNHTLPVENVPVKIKNTDGTTIYELVSDENGVTETVPLETLDKNLLDSSKIMAPDFSVYDVEIPFFEDYMQEKIHDVQIFDEITSILPVQMYPAIDTDTPQENTIDITIPHEHGVDFDRDYSSQPYWDRYSPNTNPVNNPGNNPNSGNPGNNPRNINITGIPSANEVSVPEYITVHLGSPNDNSAKNVRVRFIDYIKNVASSEIFPTWETSAIYANVFAQISFALNRVYTVWYRSRGKDFDITNSTAFDQYFVYGREIFNSINDIVNDVFNVMFLRRPGRREPFFAAYCNGTTSTCEGLSQHGSQSLALQGYTPIQILRYFYPNDIQIVETTNFTSGVTGAFPGISLREGSSGEDVRTMQIYLNRISGNWFIPPAGTPDGVFGITTKNSVTAFQKLFLLTPDGIIGKNTWFAITRVYVAAKELAELTSEGEIIGLGEAPPNVTIKLNDRGEYVSKLQFLLNFISEFYAAIPFIVQNSIFNDDTKKGVIEFQKEFNLTPDGIVGAATWRKLYKVFEEIGGAVDLPSYEGTGTTPTPQIPTFPGTPLRLGSQGSDVALMQSFLNIIAQAMPSIPVLAVDGIFGSSVNAAVTEFQRLNKLTADGIIGQVTWYKIVDSYKNITNGQSPTFPGTSLRNGSRGNDVLVMQNYLSALSRVFPVIPNLTTDGIFGNNTQRSVIAFQKLFGLPSDGIIGQYTWNRVVYVYIGRSNTISPKYPGAALKTGSRGNDVAVMQKYLNTISKLYKSIPTIKADGIFGEATRNAVIKFQKQFNLVQDGVIGINTWNQVVSVYNMVTMYLSRSAGSPTESTFATGFSQNDKYADKLALLMAASILRTF